MACGRRGDPERALKVFDRMQREGVVPKVITYSALITACATSGDVELALKVFDGMQR